MLQNWGKRSNGSEVTEMMQPASWCFSVRDTLVRLFRVWTQTYDVTCGLSIQLRSHSQAVVSCSSDLRALQEGEADWPPWVGIKQQWVTYKFMAGDGNLQEQLLKLAFHCAKEVVLIATAGKLPSNGLHSPSSVWEENWPWSHSGNLNLVLALGSASPWLTGQRVANLLRP